MAKEVEHIYVIAKEIVKDSNDIKEYLSNMQNLTDENFELVESVSNVTNNSSTSITLLVDMVEKLKSVTYDLSTIINE